MDTASDESDIDIDKVSELVENLEELDNNLFGDNRQKKSLFGIEKTKQNVKETQKKVIFRDFDDDPLDDLLSDSNNLNKNTFSNKNDNKISDLFGIKNRENLKPDTDISKSTEFNFTSNKNEEKKSFNDNWEINKPQSATSQPIVSKTFENSNNKLIISSKLSLPDRAKKSLIMEDLFGSKSRASSTNENSHEKSISKNFGSEEMISSLKPAQFTLSTSSGREPRRARPKSINLNDTLGFLNSQEQVTQTKEENLEQKAASISDIPSENLPAWLGGTKKTTNETDKQVNNSAQKTDKSDVQNNIISKSLILNQDNLLQRNTISLPNISSLTGTQFDPQISIVAMQQHEHKLRAATILSEQTDQLSSIVEGQKSKLNEQEKLFDTSIKQQIDRQLILETQIKLQQARIDHYIQALSKQQMTLPSGLQFENKDKDPMTDKQNDEKISSEYLLHTLEVEKHHLEHLVDIMKNTNEREIKILEDSHETQIRLMQENINKLEERLRGQIAEIQNEYEKKIEKLLTEKNEQEIYLKTRIENLKADQIQIIQDIHIRHSQQVDLLQKEHIKTLENISRAKETEQQTVDFIITHKTDIDSILERVQHVSDGFETLCDQMKTRDLDSLIKRESNLKRQEETLKVLIEHLITQQETMDSERKQLVNIAQKLESDTNEVTNQFVKNHKLVNERETRLEMQEKSFIHERNLFHEQIKWEREHIQCLKETWIAEQKQQLKLLANEREAVAAEKAKFEVFNNLKLNSDDLIKTELEAAIKAAHDATHQANLERQRWQEKSESLLTEQRRNEMKERQLMHRAKDLEELTQAAVIKREEGLQALKEAQRIEKQHKDKLNQLQSQLKALADRESKIAAEKVTLARERLSLKVYQVEKSEKNITNDSYHNQVKESTYMSPARVTTHFNDIVDPQLLLLKLNLDNKLDTSHQLLTDMQELI